jgi:hypothetical protein
MVKKTLENGGIQLLASRASFVPLGKKFKNQLSEGVKRGENSQGMAL